MAGKLVRHIALMMAIVFCMNPWPAAAAVITNNDIPLDGMPVTDPCDPEPILILHGDMHMVTSETISGSGNVQVDMSMNWQGVKATDLAGNTFVTSDTTEQTINVLGPFPVVENFTEDVHYVSQGNVVQNYTLHVTMKLTINANGVPTATVDHVTSDCR